MKTLFRRTSLALALTTTLVMTAQAQDLRISMYADITGWIRTTPRIMSATRFRAASLSACSSLIPG